MEQMPLDETHTDSASPPEDRSDIKKQKKRKTSFPVFLLPIKKVAKQLILKKCSVKIIELGETATKDRWE